MHCLDAIRILRINGPYGDVPFWETAQSIRHILLPTIYMARIVSMLHINVLLPPHCSMIMLHDKSAKLAWSFQEPTHHATTVGRRFIQRPTESATLIDRPSFAGREFSASLKTRRLSSNEASQIPQVLQILIRHNSLMLCASTSGLSSSSNILQDFSSQRD